MSCNRRGGYVGWGEHDGRVDRQEADAQEARPDPGLDENSFR
jgi:hypothetical protein